MKEIICIFATVLIVSFLWAMVTAAINGFSFFDDGGYDD